MGVMNKGGDSLAWDGDDNTFASGSMASGTRYCFNEAPGKGPNRRQSKRLPVKMQVRV